MNRYLLIGGVSLVVGAGIAGATYLITKRVITKKYDIIIGQELEDAKKYYEKRNTIQKPASPVDIVVEKGYREADEDEAGTGWFVGMPDKDLDWDQEEEVKNRDTDRPYIISVDEYKNDRLDYVKTDLTYYVNDDIIIDGGTVPMPDVDNLLGDENLQRFGHGSPHKNKVYIRNEELETDFEVDRNEGDFSEEVLGYIRHSQHRGRGKVMKMLRDEE